MTDVEVRKVVSEAVTETLTRLGLDMDDPLEVQRDMSFLRSWRTSTEAAKKTGFLTVITVLVTGLMGLVWLALKGS